MTNAPRPALDPAGLHGVNRRQFLRFSGALSAAAALTAALGACGGPASTNSSAGNSPAAAPTGAAGGSSPATAAASAANGSSAPSAAPTGTIECTLAFTLSSGFDPMNASSAVGTAANEHIFEGLVNLDPVSRQPYLALAKAQPTASADNKTWTVTLRDGAKFSDGTPVTAEDVAWSFTRALDPANKALMAGFISFIDTATAKDASTVEFALKTPFSLFAQRIAVIKIVPKALTKDAAASKTFDTKPVGSGPYSVTKADATAGITFGVNSHYNGPRPATVTAMTWNTTTEDSTRVADLQSGRVQAIESVPYVNVAQIKQQFQVDEVQGFNQVFLMFNCSAKPFDDKRVRQALHYALDSDQIIKTALQGFGSAATSYIDEGNSSYQKAATVYGFDADKAKSLLAAAGASNLSFELVTTDNAIVKAAAPLLIDSWKQIGVTATLNTAPSSSVYGTAPSGLVANDKFRVLAASGDPSVFGPDCDLLLRWFYYGETWPVDRFRWSKATATKATDLIDKAAQEKDAATQKSLWKQVLDLVADEAPLYPVFHTKIITGSDPKKLQGFKGAPTTGLYFLNVKRTG
ncbi:MAG: ABC transporter substrate-binding protein [Nakamurella sp.]